MQAWSVSILATKYGRFTAKIRIWVFPFLGPNFYQTLEFLVTMCELNKNSDF